MHLKSRERVFKDSRLSLCRRLHRLLETVGRTLLYGAGLWGCNLHAIDKAVSAFRSMCKICLNRRQRKGEDDTTFHKRLNNRLNYLLDMFSFVPLAAQVQKLYVSWLGHVARSRPESSLNKVFSGDAIRGSRSSAVSNQDLACSTRVARDSLLNVG